MVRVVGKEDVEDEDGRDDVLCCEEVEEYDDLEDVGCCVVEGCEIIKDEIPAAATIMTIIMRAAAILVIAFI